MDEEFAEAELLEPSLEATRSGGGGASRLRCGCTSRTPRAKGEAAAGRPSVDVERDVVACWRSGVDDIGKRSSGLVAALGDDVPLEAAGTLDREGADALSVVGCESVASASGEKAVICDAFDSFL